jgi:hypothetical protein
MEALHLRAQPDTINLIMDVLNKASKNGQEVEILDNTVFEKEHKMILNALLEEKKNEIFDHDDIWNELLK